MWPSADDSGRVTFVLVHSRLGQKYPITLLLFFESEKSAMLSSQHARSSLMTHLIFFGHFGCLPSLRSGLSRALLSGLRQCN